MTKASRGRVGKTAGEAQSWAGCEDLLEVVPVPLWSPLRLSAGVEFEDAGAVWILYISTSITTVHTRSSPP